MKFFRVNLAISESEIGSFQLTYNKANLSVAWLHNPIRGLATQSH